MASWDLDKSKKLFINYSGQVPPENAWADSIAEAMEAGFQNLSTLLEDAQSWDPWAKGSHSNCPQLHRGFEVVKNRLTPDFLNSVEGIYLGLTFFKKNSGVPDLASSLKKNGGAIICLDRSFAYATFVLQVAITQTAAIMNSGSTDLVPTSTLLHKDNIERLLRPLRESGELDRSLVKKINKEVRHIFRSNDKRTKFGITEVQLIQRIFQNLEGVQQVSEEWIIAHEISHIILDNLNDRGPTGKGGGRKLLKTKVATFLTLSEVAKNKYNQLNPHQKNEVVADLFALLLLAGYWKEERSDSKSLTISLMGALSTLATVGVLDGWEESDSHPAPFERASILVLCTLEALNPSGSGYAYDLYNVSDLREYSKCIWVLTPYVTLIKWLSRNDKANNRGSKMTIKRNLGELERLFHDYLIKGNLSYFSSE